MKIVVGARHFGYLRNFESALVELAERGHHLHLAADREDGSGGLAMVQRLAARFPSVSWGYTPARSKDDPWFTIGTAVRLSQDYLRYLERAFDRAPMLRRRAKERTPSLTVALVEKAGFRFRPGRAALRAGLDLLEAGIPAHQPYVEWLSGHAPDVVILTPLIDLGSPQLDMLKGARLLGIRTVLAVGSWDHLSSKARIRMPTDLVTVWNPVQKQEALTMHGVTESRVAVTGAQCYDQWFGRRPTRSRETFCAAMGLRADRPFVLYVCSSLFRGDPPEADFTVEWIRAVRESRDVRLQGIGILVRPHPGRPDEWAGHDVSQLGVAFHGSNPIDTQSRDDYFDAMYHAAAVVGLNTSAFLEAGIVGRPVLAILPQKYWKSQEGTLHFHYLLTVGGGLLHTSRSIDEHLPQLAGAIAGTLPIDNAPFVREFIRPFGLDAPATPRFVDAIEALGRSPAPAPSRGALAGRLVAGPLLRGLVASRGWPRRSRDAAKDAARRVRRARNRARKALTRVGRRLRDAGSRSRRRLRPSTPKRGMVGPADIERSESFELLVELLDRARRNGRPVIVGPWLSETGFELLYWIPFVRWALKYADIRPSRVTVVSRGGTAAWYGGIAEHYVDALDHCSVDGLRQALDERVTDQHGQKQYATTAFEDGLVRRAGASRGLGEFEWLHPRFMYHLFRPFWMQEAPFEVVRPFLLPRPLRVEPRGIVPGLPQRYVAVKFYSNLGLPNSPDTVRFVRDVLARVTSRYDVVLLHTGLQMDDHNEYQPETSPRVFRVDHLMNPSNNLDVQTRVIAGADALVTTYGGFSYLGPLLGVRTMAFYDVPSGFRADHLEVAHRTFRELEAPPFVVLATRDVHTLDDLLGQVNPAVQP
ncbi:MAG: hypothetical protein AB1635_00895 [Acidobacteriota bacterium]